MELIRFVDVATARAARGVRMVLAALLPSPWSEAAKGIFHVKRIPVQAVRFSVRDPELASWTAAQSAPVVFHDGDPPRTGWAEILALAERLGGDVPLVPPDAPDRVRLHGLAHELAGEGGLGWNTRLLMLDGSLRTAGARSFPLPVAQRLAGKYGYAAERIPAARTLVIEALAHFDRVLAESRARGHRYLLGDRLSALDIYLAVFLTPVVGIAEADCPTMRPEVRSAFRYLGQQVGAQVTAALAAHRTLIYREYLSWPIEL
jgi:glutathione S-transferase